MRQTEEDRKSGKQNCKSNLSYHNYNQTVHEVLVQLESDLNLMR